MMVAVGIVSFGIIAMVSMMPSGLSTFRNSMDRSISSQIAQRIVNEARQTDFATLTNFTDNSTTSYKYFTDEGDETTIGAANQIYVARVDIVKQVSVPGASIPNQNMA
ncbi:MAG: Verru_Chthon cassette protein B, partial [Verrucomicrobiota bacterium]